MSTRVGRFGETSLVGRELGSRNEGIVRQCRRERVPLFVVDDLFEERLRCALCDPAVDLPLGEKRVQQFNRNRLRRNVAGAGPRFPVSVSTSTTERWVPNGNVGPGDAGSTSARSGVPLPSTEAWTRGQPSCA